MVVFIELHNKYGVFTSAPLNIESDEEYNKLIETSSSFYKTGAGFEMYLDDGFIVFPPSILSESMLKIKIQENGI